MIYLKFNLTELIEDFVRSALFPMSKRSPQGKGPNHEILGKMNWKQEKEASQRNKEAKSKKGILKSKLWKQPKNSKCSTLMPYC